MLNKKLRNSCNVVPRKADQGNLALQKQQGSTPILMLDKSAIWRGLRRRKTRAVVTLSYRGLYTRIFFNAFISRQKASTPAHLAQEQPLQINYDAPISFPQTFAPRCCLTRCHL